jgi:asparaginyl-tRNA synthetase
MDCAEAYLKSISSYVLKHCTKDMVFLNRFIATDLIEKLEKICSTPFERATYTYAIRILEKSGRSFQYPVKWGIDLQTEHERFLTEEYFQKPVIITDYPKDIKAFYMRANGDQKTVAAMDILIPKIGEIIGGSQREERYDVLRERIIASKIDPQDYWWYF